MVVMIVMVTGGDSGGGHSNSGAAAPMPPPPASHAYMLANKRCFHSCRAYDVLFPCTILALKGQHHVHKGWYSRRVTNFSDC